jgi:hypothetical protein
VICASFGYGLQQLVALKAEEQLLMRNSSVQMMGLPPVIVMHLASLMEPAVFGGHSLETGKFEESCQLEY